ncbi:TolC family outer membrane protein [Legionella sp. CNM-4043-24]|uniref:TolC family outer membrane protein n=1 Tax=Legionella sp. CNM-4043-24 TaxID=3421646 RepID=UPI00403ABCA3
MRFRNFYRTSTGLIAATMLTGPLAADTLAEAIQQSLITHPDVLLSSSSTLPKEAGSWHPGLSLNQPASHGSSLFSSTASLALSSAEARINELKRQDIADDLALGVVDRYLDVLRCNKLMEAAQNNFRLHRSIYITLSQQKDSSAAHRSELRQVRARLAQAESAQLRAETRRHAAKTIYAKVVGRWPMHLEWPEGPASTDLPGSVGQAIEQGLDNYAMPVSTNPDTQKMERRSMIALSKAIRESWEDWTAAGLQLNPLQKQLSAAEDARNELKEQFKQGQATGLQVLDAQAVYYRLQKEHINVTSRELSARYQILNSIGRLTPFVIKGDEEDGQVAAVSDLATTAESTLLQMAELDKTDYPYPSYKPQFQEQMAHMMQVTALNMPDLNTVTQAPVSTHKPAWYVSAGDFKNKANAIALTERLKTLGFMVVLQANGNSSSVLIGPYEYRTRALRSMKRLKDTAHVQGVLVLSKEKANIG